LLGYFLNEYEMVPVAPIITGITFVFTFRMRCISTVRSLGFKIFSVSYLIQFYLLKLQHKLTYMFLFNHRRLFYPVYG
jgi:hypothetical protein